MERSSNWAVPLVGYVVKSFSRGKKKKIEIAFRNFLTAQNQR
jgi:hypothetical protein